jgi:hypothetical protein
MKYTLERPRSDQYPTEKIIDELLRVPDLYGHRHFSRHEFDEKAIECNGSVVLSERVGVRSCNNTFYLIRYFYGETFTS